MGRVKITREGRVEITRKGRERHTHMMQVKKKITCERRVKITRTRTLAKEVKEKNKGAS